MRRMAEPRDYFATGTAIFARCAALLVIAVTLAACDSGSEDGEGGTVNQPPVANAGGDQTVAEMTVVQLAGSGSDPDPVPSSSTEKSMVPATGSLSQSHPCHTNVDAARMAIMRVFTSSLIKGDLEIIGNLRSLQDVHLA